MNLARSHRERAERGGERSPAGATPIRPDVAVASHRVTPRRALAALALLIALGVAGYVGHVVFPPAAVSSAAAIAPLFSSAARDVSTGRIAAAQTIYTRILQLDPASAKAYYDLGVTYQQHQDDSQAVLAYERALLLDPRFNQALFNLAVIESPSSPSVAIALYDRLQSYHPANAADVALNLGLLLCAEGQVRAGEEELFYAVQLNPQLASRIPSRYRPAAVGSGT